jgi:beta-glucosidase
MIEPMSPGSFFWGAASSAFQVEGHVLDDGRGQSKWDVYTHDYDITDAVVGNHHHADGAINAYDRRQYLADIALMREAGLDAYRFSISWPRIFPEGKGAVNRTGVDHYSRFVDDLLAAGIAPLPTLYHWDFPQALHAKGGWHNRDVIGWFTDYADVVFRALGDRIATFITLNEPYIDLFMMDLIAERARDHKPDPMRATSADFGRQAPAMHHMLTAHARAVEAFRSDVANGRIGIALPLYPTIPVDPEKPDDVAAAELTDGLLNRWFLDAVLRGSYPQDVVAALKRHNPKFAPTESDMAVLKANPVDFVGINFYSPAYVRRDDAFPHGLGWGNADTNPDKVKAFNGPVRPDELYRLLLRFRDEYGNPPVAITENGTGYGDFDEVLDGDVVKDPLRTGYITRHIEATLRARSEGVDVRGFLVWSLFDNFEWIQGYDRRFGMVYVDFATQKRIPKQSFYAYRDIIVRERDATG